MPDYNIYIHSDTSGSGKKKTTAKDKKSSASKTTPKESKALQYTTEAINTASNPDSLVSKGVGAVAKAVPAVAVAFAVAGLVDKVATTIISFNTINTGDFSAQIGYQNFKSAIGGILRPFSTTLNYALSVREANVNQRRVNEQMRLLGDSVINNNNYGV